LLPLIAKERIITMTLPAKSIPPHQPDEHGADAPSTEVKPAPTSHLAAKAPFPEPTLIKQGSIPALTMNGPFGTYSIEPNGL
jgi:hypothetical protein